MSDLMVLALQTDTTRVCTLAMGEDGAMFPGVVTVGYEHHAHTLEHQGNAGRVEDADPISREGCRQIHEWQTMLFSEMAQKMAKIDEGGSTLPVNTMLLYTSYMSDGVIWSEPVQATGKILRRFAVSEGRAVGVGDYGRRSATTDGTIWIDTLTPKPAETCIDVAFGNGVFGGAGLHGLRWRAPTD